MAWICRIFHRLPPPKESITPPPPGTEELPEVTPILMPELVDEAKVTIQKARRVRIRAEMLTSTGNFAEDVFRGVRAQKRPRPEARYE